jgi:hypothetical protein
MANEFLIYESHDKVICFHCDNLLKDGDWHDSEYPSGKYYKSCPESGYNTYYDLPPKVNAEISQSTTT